MKSQSDMDYLLYQVVPTDNILALLSLKFDDFKI